MHAARGDCLDAAKLLLESGADVNHIGMINLSQFRTRRPRRVNKWLTLTIKVISTRRLTIELSRFTIFTILVHNTSPANVPFYCSMPEPMCIR